MLSKRPANIILPICRDSNHCHTHLLVTTHLVFGRLKGCHAEPVEARAPGIANYAIGDYA